MKDTSTPETVNGEPGEAVLNELRFNELPAKLQNLFDEDKQLYSVKKAPEAQFSPIDLSIPVKEVIDPRGRSTYTIVLESSKQIKSTETYYFGNW